MCTTTTITTLSVPANGGGEYDFKTADELVGWARDHGSNGSAGVFGRTADSPTYDRVGTLEGDGEFVPDDGFAVCATCSAVFDQDGNEDERFCSYYCADTCTEDES